MKSPSLSVVTFLGLLLLTGTLLTAQFNFDLIASTAVVDLLPQATEVVDDDPHRETKRSIDELVTSTTLTPFSVSGITGEKPQSKVWEHNGTSWAVMPSTAPDPSGTWVWRLEADNSWTAVLHLSNSTGTKADVKRVGDIVHVLLWNGSSTSLVSIEHVVVTNAYQLWSARPAATAINLSGSEIATIDVDSTGRMWLATEDGSEVNVYHSTTPYSSFSGPITLTNNINEDDIASVIAMPGNRVGVLWSNQDQDRFGFKIRNDADAPEVWSGEEFAASGNNVADDHINLKVTSDGTLYAAVKTSFDSGGQPAIAMLVRRPDGTWDDLYPVSNTGTRGILILNESEGTLRVIYTSSESSGNILYRESPLDQIAFGPVATLISGSLNNATSAKENWTNRVVVLAAGGSQASGVLLESDEAPPTGGSLVGHWRMDEGAGPTLADSSGNLNNASLSGAPIWNPDSIGGLSLYTQGATDYGSVADNSSLDITSAITMAAWIKPSGGADTRYILKKSSIGVSDGYELSLASTGKVFVRFNEDTSGNDYRVDSISNYPLNSAEWMHVAATYDGTTIRLFINGLEENSKSISGTIGTNTDALGIGAQGDGFRNFRGQLDEVRLYSVALSPADISSLATNTAPVVDAGPDQAVTFPTMAELLGIVTDDGYPAGTLTTQWSKVSGEGAVAFGNASAAQTTASFSAPGVYVLRLTANDGSILNWDEAVITVTSDGTPSTLLGHWTMDEGTGTTFLDSSGNGNHGQMFGDAAFRPGRVGPNAISFGGAGNGLIQDNDILDVTGPMTIALWINPGRATTQHLFKKGTDNDGNNAYEVSLSDASAPSPQRFFARVRTSTGSTVRIDSDAQYQLNVWSHIAVVHTGTDLRMYVNGQLQADVKPVGALATNSHPLGVGYRPVGDNWFLGQLDEIRLYGSSLTEAEILALANPAVVNSPPVVSAGDDQSVVLPASADLAGIVSDDGLPEPASLTSEWTVTSGPGDVVFSDASEPQTTASFTVAGSYVLRLTVNDGEVSSFDEVVITVFSSQILPGPVGYWPMDEGSGQFVIDASGNGLDGTRAGAMIWSADRIHGPFSMDLANDDHALVADDERLDITSSITMAAWVRPTARRTQYILKKRVGANTTAPGYELSISGTGFPFVRFGTDPATRLNSTYQHPASNADWFHVAATWDGSTISIYINGVLDTSRAFAGPIGTNDLPLGIGADSAGASDFRGLLDDVRLYNVALDPVQIQKVFSNQQPGLPLQPSPADDEAGVDSSPVLSVTVIDPNNDNLSVSFYGRPAVLETFGRGGRALLGTNGFELISTDTEVTSGGIAQAVWESRSPSATYEWYVVISDGLNSTIGPVWTFTTLGPTSATVPLSGRVVDAKGRGLRNAQVMITGTSGETRRAFTSSFGYFRFEDVQAGDTYLITTSAKGYQFEARTVSVESELMDVIIVSN